MSIYRKKQKWKVILVITAILIIAASLWYTNRIVKNIAREERNQVRLWAGAIQKKANLVKYTNELFKRLSQEERKKVELWAEATKRLVNSSDVEDFSFVLKVVTENSTVPVILADANDKVISHRNLDSAQVNDPNYLRQQMMLMRSVQEPIEVTILNNQKNYLYYKDSKLFSELKTVLDDLIRSFISEIVVNSASVPVIFTDSTRTKVIAYGNIDTTKISTPEKLKEYLAEIEESKPPILVEFGEGRKNLIFYEDSFLLTQLKFYPFIQLGIIGLFLFIAYTLFSTARKAEQNQVWVGMAKETAHQLGTPLSSLIAWVELLKERGMHEESTEVEKDIHRLETITERFSKIGSVPVLKKENIYNAIEEVVSYMKTRTSGKVTFNITGTKDVLVPLNVPLFEWVIENLIRNAVDAMEACGTITISISDQIQFVYVDISDTGKGIPKSKFKTIFEPGYTTKKRGWGLGLSLTKRIIENYHSAKIFVKSSEPDKGTTFRIVMNK